MSSGRVGPKNLTDTQSLHPTLKQPATQVSPSSTATPSTAKANNPSGLSKSNPKIHKTPPHRNTSPATNTQLRPNTLVATPAPIEELVVEFNSNMNATKLSTIEITQNYNSGKSVSVGDSLILMGTPNDLYNGSESGATYIFQSGNSWSQQVKLTPIDGQQKDQFGMTTAISGNYALVGSPYSDSGATDYGSAYVFKGGNQ